MLKISIFALFFRADENTFPLSFNLLLKFKQKHINKPKFAMTRLKRITKGHTSKAEMKQKSKVSCQRRYLKMRLVRNLWP